MPRLNTNQKTNRVQSLCRQMRAVLDGLHIDDQRAIVKEAVSSILPEEESPADVSTGDLDARIKRAVLGGLGENDPQMVRAALAYQAEQMGKDYLSDLQVNIVPYRVKDDSLPKIVLEADESIIRQIEVALLVRRKREQSPPPVDPPPTENPAPSP